MRQLYSFGFLLFFALSLIILHKTTYDYQTKQKDLNELSSKLNFVWLSTNFKTNKYKDFVYE
jgi:hypothetical protein